MTAPACVLLVCGLPGAGKSTLCHALVQHVAASRAYAVVHVCLDTVFERIHGGSAAVMDADTAAELQAARRLALQAVARMLHGDLTEGSEQAGALLLHPSVGTRAAGVLIVVEDNFQYRSMRLPYFQLARDAGAAFLQCIVDCAVDVALRRDAARHAPVGATSVRRIASQFERPPTALDAPGARGWQRWSRLAVEVNAEEEVARNVQRVCEAVEQARAVPVPPPPDTSAWTQASRDANARSVMHQADSLSRASLSRVLSSGGAGHRAVGGALAAVRRGVVDEARTALRCAPTASGGDGSAVSDWVRELLVAVECGGAVGDASAAAHEAGCVVAAEFERRARAVLEEASAAEAPASHD